MGRGSHKSLGRLNSPQSGEWVIQEYQLIVAENVSDVRLCSSPRGSCRRFGPPIAYADRACEFSREERHCYSHDLSRLDSDVAEAQLAQIELQVGCKGVGRLRQECLTYVPVRQESLTYIGIHSTNGVQDFAWAV